MIRLELGALSVVIEDPDELKAFMRPLCHHMSQKETAEVLGISDRTLRRWRAERQLPLTGPLTLMELLNALTPQQVGFAARLPLARSNSGSTPVTPDKKPKRGGKAKTL